MSMQKLLDIDPQRVAFRLEVGRQASCRINISNNSQDHVAFKVMTTNVNKYSARPNVGVLKPEECLEITATMQALTEIPSYMECDDEFLIRSVVATPLHTPETAHELFSEGTRAFEDCRLKVVYVSNALVVASQMVRIGIDLLKNIVFLYLIIRLLEIKILPGIWSLKFWMVLLIIKWTEYLLAYSAENWIDLIKKTLLHVCVLTVLIVCRRWVRWL